MQNGRIMFRNYAEYSLALQNGGRIFINFAKWS